jgi:hypothetical protein
MTSFIFRRALLGLVSSHHEGIFFQEELMWKIRWLFNLTATASIFGIVYPIMYWVISGYRCRDLGLIHRYPNQRCLQYGQKARQVLGEIMQTAWILITHKVSGSGIQILDVHTVVYWGQPAGESYQYRAYQEMQLSQTLSHLGITEALSKISPTFLASAR